MRFVLGSLGNAKAQNYCPEYVLGNAGAVGYYRVRYEGELLTKLAPLLTGTSSSLSESEKVSLLGDLRAGMVDGSLSAAQALQLVEPLAAEPSRHVLAEVLRLLWLVRDALAPDQLPAYERMQTSLFGARLAALGLVARPADDDNTKLVRGQLMYQVLVEGHDRAQNHAAQELLTAHLRQKKRLDPETADQLLSTAVPHGDRALWTLLHEAAKAEKDRSRRGQLLSALGSFRDPQLARASLDLILSGEFPTIETLTLLYGPQSGPLTRQLPFEFLKRSFDSLAAKLPKELPAKLSGVAAALCTPALRTEAEQFFKSRTTRYTGGNADHHARLHRYPAPPFTRHFPVTNRHHTRVRKIPNHPRQVGIQLLAHAGRLEDQPAAPRRHQRMRAKHHVRRPAVQQLDTLGKISHRCASCKTLPP